MSGSLSREEIRATPSTPRITYDIARRSTAGFSSVSRMMRPYPLDSRRRCIALAIAAYRALFSVGTMAASMPVAGNSPASPADPGSR